MKDEIVLIATRLRAIAEAQIKKHNGLNGSFSGFCIAVSLALRGALEKKGYQSRVVRGRFQNRGHAWVEAQGLIVDISLDQFSGCFPRVYVGDTPDTRYQEVIGDEEFEKQMGVAGDDVQWTYLDDQGEECPLGTTRSVARHLLAMYDSADM
jgi:hypothetical protein